MPPLKTVQIYSGFLNKKAITNFVTALYDIVSDSEFTECPLTLHQKVMLH
jgi:hypothetical protein